ncbi:MULTISPECIES: hypothetical protein [unclassified Bilifractor]|uniref:hypothetical protein n=1 Tax=unclassified Bilifractor TaxID=2815795 RepID=UPI003F8FEFB1
MTHRQAQAIRKMSDQELMDYVNDTCMSAYNAGISKGNSYVIRHLIEMISNLPGVGVVTMKRITRLCEKEGLLDD